MVKYKEREDIIANLEMGPKVSVSNWSYALKRVQKFNYLVRVIIDPVTQTL